MHRIETQFAGRPFMLESGRLAKQAAGSALLKDERLVSAILRATVRAVNVPVTLKIRTGWTDHEVVAVEAATLIEEKGAAAITVHGRARKSTA